MSFFFMALVVLLILWLRGFACAGVVVLRKWWFCGFCGCRGLAHCTSFFFMEMVVLLILWLCGVSVLHVIFLHDFGGLIDFVVARVCMCMCRPFPIPFSL